MPGHGNRRRIQQGYSPVAGPRIRVYTHKKRDFTSVLSKFLFIHCITRLDLQLKLIIIKINPKFIAIQDHTACSNFDDCELSELVNFSLA